MHKKHQSGITTVEYSICVAVLIVSIGGFMHSSGMFSLMKNAMSGVYQRYSYALSNLDYVVDHHD